MKYTSMQLMKVLFVFSVLSVAFSLQLNRFMNMKLSVGSGKVLILQNKGGGHGEIGYQLCKTIKADAPNCEIVVLQDECNYKKPPFSSYSKDLIEGLGVKVLNEKLTGAESISGLSVSAVKGMKFDYIVDNFSKGTQNATFTIDVAKSSGAKQVVFISSAGMYKGSGKLPHDEKDPVKENDARKVEMAIEASGTPFTFLRPQYIYGPNANKRYLDFFIGRAARKLPIPLPLHGEQLVCLTHVEDVASLIATTLGEPKAMKQIFNCGTNRMITYKGLSDAIHKALGNNVDTDAKYLFYEPKDFDNWDGSGVQEFPFRRDTFVTTPNKISTMLGWQPKHSIVKDVDMEVKIYENAGGMKEEWSTGKELKYDQEVMALKVK